MNIIAFDTCFGQFSVSLAINNEIIADFTEFETGKQSAGLILAINELLKKAKINYDDLDVVVTTIGPGSFTGVRIGLSVAKMLGLTLKTQIQGFSTMEILASKFFALNENSSTKQVSILVEARKGQFYMQEFLRKDGGLILPESEIKMLNYEDLSENSDKIIVAMESPLSEFAEESLKKNKKIQKISVFDASDLIRHFIYCDLLDAIEEKPAGEISPIYVRPPDAKISSKSLI